MMESDKFKNLLHAISEMEPDFNMVDLAWKNTEGYIREKLEKVHKLETVSGYSIDTLISLFEAGWRLSVSNEPTIPTLPANWWATEQVKEATRLRDEFLAKPIDIDVEELEDMVRKINGGSNETR